MLCLSALISTFSLHITHFFLILSMSLLIYIFSYYTNVMKFYIIQKAYKVIRNYPQHINFIF